MSKLAIPTIHLNGTSKEHLVAYHLQALEALQHARAFLMCTSPNARDFYPQGDKAFSEAAYQHEMRLAKVDGIASEIATILDRISEC